MYSADHSWYAIKYGAVGDAEGSETIAAVKLTCPRKDCGKWYIIDATELGNESRTRSCPHCFKGARQV